MVVLMTCQHHKLKPQCKGDVRHTPHGVLCYAHEYQAFLRVRCGLDVEPDSYGAENEMPGTIFEQQETNKNAPTI